MGFSPQRLHEELERVFAAAGVVPEGLCVALSGGLDSTVLLRALADGAAAGQALRAVHVDHGLHADAALWSRHSRSLAEDCGVRHEVVQVAARPGPGESPEATARAARYAALAARLRPGEALLTAHHADDQLETVLLQWLRGGGLSALAAMREVTAFGPGWLVRPLLGFTRAELLDWGTSRGLAWVEDPSNADRRLDRNYLRHEVLPALRARWPAAARTVGRVAGQVAEALEIEQQVAAVDLAEVTAGTTLDLARLASLSVPRQRLALRAWLRSRGIDPPSAGTLAALRHDMLTAGRDRIPETRWGDAVVHRYRGRLHAERGPDSRAPWPGGIWRPGAAFDLGPWGRLELREAQGEGISRARLAGPLSVEPRPTGALFRPAGSPHRRELRKWLQERGVLPWRRAGLPCVLAGGEVVAIGDLACGGTLAATPGEPAWRVHWHDRPVLTEAEALGGCAPS